MSLVVVVFYTYILAKVICSTLLMKILECSLSLSVCVCVCACDTNKLLVPFLLKYYFYAKFLVKVMDTHWLLFPLTVVP